MDIIVRTPVTEIEDNLYFFECPHCGGGVTVKKTETNCKIFRHGEFVNTKRQLNPHAPKLQCDRHAQNKEIFGCGKPFLFVLDDNGNHTVIKCEYI